MGLRYGRRERWTNWGGNQSCEALVCRPGDEEELAEIIKEADRTGRRLRVVGTTHAWAKLIAQDAGPSEAPIVIVSLEHFTGVHDIDVNKRTCWVRAGTLLSELTDALAEHGLMPRSPTVFPGLAVGGIVGTASHGTGNRDTETFSDHVLGFRMISPAKGVVTVDDAAPLSAAQEALLFAVRCSMGTIGVLTDIKLRLDPCYFVREVDTLVPAQEAICKIPDYVARHEFVEMFWMPFNDRLWVKTYDRTAPRFYPWWKRLRFWLGDNLLTLFQKTIYPLVLELLSRFPVWTPTASKLFGALIPTGDRVRQANDVFHFQKAYPRHVAMAFVVDLDDAPALWRLTMGKIRSFAAASAYPVSMIVESRYIWDSDGKAALRDEQPHATLLSPAVFPNTAYVEVVTYHKTPGQELFFRALEDAVLATFPDALPHWGKLFFRGRDLRARYGHAMTTFLAIREAHDPRRTLLNRFLEKEVFHL